MIKDNYTNKEILKLCQASDVNISEEEIEEIQSKFNN